MANIRKSWLFLRKMVQVSKSRGDDRSICGLILPALSVLLMTPNSTRTHTVLELSDAAGTLCQLAADGKVEKLRLLLSLGIDPNVADYDKRTPLHTASSEGMYLYM